MNLIKIETTYAIDQSHFTKDELLSLREEIDAILSPNKEQEEETKSLKETYFELYDRLPKWIADRAKTGFLNKSIPLYSDIPLSVKEAIRQGFYWNQTEEKHDFWSDVQAWLIGNQPHPPFPPELEKPREDSVYLGKGGEFKKCLGDFQGWYIEAKLNENELWGLKGRAYNCCGIDKDRHYAAPADSEIVKLNYGNPPK